MNKTAANIDRNLSANGLSMEIGPSYGKKKRFSLVMINCNRVITSSVALL